MEEEPNPRELSRLDQQQSRQPITEARRQRQREYEQTRLQNMTDEQRASRLELRRVAQRTRRLRIQNNNEVTGQHRQTAETAAEIRRNRARERRAAMTPGERERQLALRRTTYRQRRERSQNPTTITDQQPQYSMVESVTGVGTSRLSVLSRYAPGNSLHEQGGASTTSNSTIHLAAGGGVGTSNHDVLSHYGDPIHEQGGESTAANSTIPPAPGNSILEHTGECTTSNATVHRDCGGGVVMEGQGDANDNENEDDSVLPNNQPFIQRRYHKCARSFHERDGLPTLQLPPPRRCSHCDAKLFYRETSSMCCNNGTIRFPNVTAPPEMLELFSAQTRDGRHFRKHIRAYNHVFSFTSMDVHLDESLASTSRGVYTFRAQGSIYHRIGSLIPGSRDRPRFLQLYIFDTEHETQNRLLENGRLRQHLIERIKGILNIHNPFVHTLRHLALREDLPECSLIIKDQPRDRRQYNLPTASEVSAILVGGEEAGHLRGRDIVVQSTTGRLHTVQDIAGYYDPLQYPLLLSYGTYGWDVNSRSNNGRKVTCCDFYSYMLQIRPNDQSLLLRGGRLLQQYVVDNYVKIETNKLRWVRFHQDDIRAELYQGLLDSMHRGENCGGNVGRPTILPSSIVGTPRDMYQRYQDAMALVQKYGKPDIFLTMTCNPNWSEIKSELNPGETPNDRPDLTSRIFRSKFEELKDDILIKNVFGRVIAYVYVIEFQKRGLPHVHMLLILDENDKLNSPDDYDAIVRAEIPDKREEPRLHSAVLKHMIHGPCGRYNMQSPCMEDGRCKKKYPKPFCSATTMGQDSYPIYQRNEGPLVPLESNSQIMIDNSWVVPYNPWLLLKYDCHINVEICSSIKSVKYLYKYVYKGPDRIALEVRQNTNNHDEIRQYVDGRWICAPEAFWRIFKFTMSRMTPSIERLQIHLPNMQHVSFYRHENIGNILSDENLSRTMLTQFFQLNAVDTFANRYLYREIPQFYKWDKEERAWKRRRSCQRVIGRIYTVSPSEGERFYLRILLNHIKGPTSFENLLEVSGNRFLTFKQAAERRGLLEHDDSIRECLLEASSTHMPSTLRRLFVTILVYCSPTGVRNLWEEVYPFMVEDYISSTNAMLAQHKVLYDLQSLLEQHNKRLDEYDLPQINYELVDTTMLPKVIQDELSVIIPQADIDSISSLNSDQRYAFDTIMSSAIRRESRVFFVDGPGGTGKTYLYRALLASARSEGNIAIATATSGIAATLMPGGRTAHSRFKIPLNLDHSSMCFISKQSDLAELIRRATIIIWDEATMTNRNAFEALNRTFIDILGTDLPFGGKIMVFGGDFRQVLPVIPKGTKAETIAASIMKSPLWNQVEILPLKQNMRTSNDQEFAEFLLRVGDGVQSTNNDDLIVIPSSMTIPWDGETSVNCLIDSIYPDIGNHVYDGSYMVKRGLITPLNEDVDILNERVIQKFPGREHVYYSFDEVEDDSHNLYQQEFLNSISPGGLPPHALKLKKGAPIMLVRNIDPAIGLCNGTRLLCRSLQTHFIDSEILTGPFKGTRVFLPRIPLKPPDNVKLPFNMTRKQFPVRLSFALTINKSQGQTIPHVGVYLPDHVFSHGQLYVALSRGVSQSTTKVLVKKDSGSRGEVSTRNVVYKEVLLPRNT